MASVVQQLRSGWVPDGYSPQDMANLNSMREHIRLMQAEAISSHFAECDTLTLMCLLLLQLHDGAQKQKAGHARLLEASPPRCAVYRERCCGCVQERSLRHAKHEGSPLPGRSAFNPGCAPAVPVCTPWAPPLIFALCRGNPTPFRLRVSPSRHARTAQHAQPWATSATSVGVQVSVAITPRLAIFCSVAPVHH